MPSKTTEAASGESHYLAELESKGMIKIAGAMYNLETATLDFFA
jgi:hypothetical protein